MGSTPEALAVLIGLGLRLAVPILLTVLVVVVLRKLDAHWQAEAKGTRFAVQKPRCWQSRRCSVAARENCPGYRSPLPCWQVFRMSSGYLDEKCLACPVLLQAPLPAHA
jgi:hypothetical protein